MSAAPTAAGPVCWVDLAWDRTNASDRVSRYGAYLRGHAEEFESWHGEDQDGITTDPGEFAAAAFRVACGPIMSPGDVRWHPRILDHQVGHGENAEPGRRQGSGPGVGCRDQPDRGAGAGQAGGR